MEKELLKIDKKIEKEFEKIERIEKDREKKSNERESEVQKRIERMEKERDKDEKDKDKMEREGRAIRERDMRDAFRGQRTRLHELFSQIEKEFEMLWEENGELRKKLEDIRQIHPSVVGEFQLKREGSRDNTIGSRIEKSRLNPLKKKDREPEWERLTHFVGHRDGIWDVSTCRWEKQAFATASADRTARVWSSDAGAPVYIYTAHTGSVNSIRFHPTNRLVCTASGDGSVHVWKLPKNEEKKPAKDDKQDHTNKVWSPLLEKEKTDKSQPQPEKQDKNATMPEPPPIPALEENVIQTTTDNKFGIVTITRERALFDLRHKGPVTAADWTTGDKLVSGGWDNVVKIWALENGRCLSEFDAGHEVPNYVTNITTHATSPFFLNSSSDGCFRIWDIRLPQPLVNTVQAHSDIITTACFAPADDNLIVSGGDDRSVKVWDRRSLRAPRNVVRCAAGVNRLAVSSVSSNIAIPLDDSRTKIVDINGKLLGRNKAESKHHIRLLVTSAAWSTDESVLFTAGFDKAVIAWTKPLRISKKIES